ncbi:MAG: hypothetical protein A3F54_03620 [Candidatus Kerfeldbacteria bacterium RIFCSPHIGHO2_12_FULL_48_17]|uniref:Beta-ketoacyl-ACP reductase n=1 Tax=Candidatus Kerfeldbacteria bacterium RIFCSPHIGHO2_12_FULL_48_17 TaxID=1798542 RepID=A0A1G2AZR4_9BACT|nr:MAG: hypothetical protein A3F54_03620 [Candidatus Kerfeldbacteria bacterium RIFCSPHIGHO2_12_FULL_48_17]
MDLREKIILVTGASSGIGQATAIACAQKGARVIVHYRKNKAGAEDTLKKMGKSAKGVVVQADLTQPEQIKRMFPQVAQEVGKIHILVNNAGEAQSGDFFDNAQWQAQFANIFFSALHVSQYFLQQNTDAAMRKIVNIGSLYGNPQNGNVDYFSYSVAKTALHSMTINLAKLDAKVLVNAIAPGYTWTPAWEGISAAEKQLCESRTRTGRFVQPEEVTQMTIAVLENDSLTGQIITVDGGLGLQTLERK